jgi:hypothetical protein
MIVPSERSGERDYNLSRIHDEGNHYSYNISDADPLRIPGLKQAVYVLQCLECGDTEETIIKKFEGDSQIVRIWINFLIHNHWVLKSTREPGRIENYCPERSCWTVTSKGHEWASKICNFRQDIR